MGFFYLDDGRFAVSDENGDDGDGEENSATGDANGNDGQERVPPHVLHFQVETAAFVVVRPSTGTAIGAFEFVFHVLPGVAAIATPAARIALMVKEKRRTRPIN